VSWDTVNVGVVVQMLVLAALTTAPTLATAARLVAVAPTSMGLTGLTTLVALAARAGIYVWRLGASVSRFGAATAGGVALVAVPGGLAGEVVLIAALDLARSKVSVVNL
jgi:hypothetical protein